MGLAGRIARRSLLGHPGRTFFSILGVAVGIATVIGVFTLDHVTVLSRTKQLMPDFGADMEVRPTTEETNAREQLLAMEGVAGVAAFTKYDIGFRRLEARPGEDDRPQRIRLIGLETAAAQNLGVYHVDVGDDLRPETIANSVLIGGNLAREYGLGLGDRVVLSQPRNAAKKKCVEGQYTKVPLETVPDREGVFTITGILAREALGRQASGRVIIIDIATGKELLKDVFLESQFWVRRDDGTDIENLESTLASKFDFKRNEAKAVGQMADERAFRNGVRMAGLFALLLGLFVIFHTLSMSLIERVREVGNLHALGATRVQIARIFFAEAFVIAAAAAVLGLVGGLALAAVLLRNGISTLGVTGHPVTPFEVPWGTVLSLALLGFAVALFGSVYPILRARNTDVVAALRGEDARGPRGTVARGFSVVSTLLLVAVVPAAFFQVVPIVGAAESTLIGTMFGGLVVLGLLIGLPLMAPGLFGSVAARLARPFEGPFPLVGKLVSRNLRNSPNRIGSAIAAIALVASAFVGLKGMTNSLLGEIEVFGRDAMRDKVWIEGLPNVEMDAVLETLHGLPGVVGVESGDARAFPSFLLFGMDASEISKYGPLAEDPELARRMREEHAILLSDRLARQRGLDVGDQVLIQTSGHGVQEFTVAGVTDAYGYFLHPDERAFGVVDERHLERYFCIDTDKTTSIGVKLDPSAGPGGLALVAGALRERFPKSRGLYLYDADSILAILVDDLRVDFVLFDIIMFLTAVLACLGVLNGQLLAAMERKKELGILRALGTTRAQVAGAVLLESALLGGAGGLLGVIVGSGMTPVLVSSLRIISGLPLPLRFAGPFLAVALACALLLALVAGLYPIWRMNRFDAVRAVRT